MVRLGVMASGEGTNFAALHDACRSGYLEAEIVCVLSDREASPVLERARAAGVDAVFVDRKLAADREAYDEMLVAELERRGVELECNAGFMKILGRTFCKTFADRALNVHPSLLPAFAGADAIGDALEWGAKTTGATVHFVTEQLDMGPIVLQRAVDIASDETRETLLAKIHLLEYAIYPKAVKLFIEDALRIEGRRVRVLADVDAPPWGGSLPPSLR